MADLQSWAIIASFFNGSDLRALSVHQNLRSQQKEVIMVTGEELKVPIDLDINTTLHRPNRNQKPLLIQHIAQPHPLGVSR